MKIKISEAIELRQKNKLIEAMDILQNLMSINAEDPYLNYQIAWTFDCMGKESAAVSYYEKALSNGLAEDRNGAMLGLGSTYRCLGSYEKSLKIFDAAIAEFPEDRSLKTFRALTLFNLGKSQESIEQLLIQLLDTTSDSSIKGYEKALRFYSDKLTEVWK